jgi:hypothetical protein
VDHRDGRAPVPLPRDTPVLQPVLDRPAADPSRLGRCRHPRPRDIGSHARELVGIDALTVLSERLGERRVVCGLASDRLHDNMDRQPVLARELEVALVVRGHRHDRAGAITTEHEVRDPYRDGLAGEGIHHAAAGVEAFLLDLAGHAAETILLPESFRLLAERVRIG